MTSTLKISLFVGIIITALLLVGSQILIGYQAHASAGQLPGTLASTTAITEGTGTGGGLAIATSTCSARVISTSGTSGIMITFSDYAFQTPTAIFGNWQGASTTVVYDAALYGCGAVRIFSFATQQVTVTDVR